MTYVHFVQADGAPRRAHLDVPVKCRRRLSALMREHRLDTGREEPMYVSVTRANRLQTLKIGSFVDAISKPDAELQVLRRDWSKTVIGQNDVITITYLPGQGGGGGGGGRGAKNGVAIGASIAAILLAVVAPFAVPAIATAMGFAAGSLGAAAVGVAYAGVIIGLNYLASRAAQAKANKESDNRPLYGVSGGGNLPKPGDRIPAIYGLWWTTPALSQPDYSIYEGEDQTLFKRMTIGVGEYTLKAVRLGTQEVWRDGSYLNDLGGSVQIEYIAPGGTSSLVPATITASPDVAGIELPRPGASPAWAGPYRASPAGVQVTKLQFNVVCPGGVFVMGPTGGKFAGTSYETVAHAVLAYAPCDGNGNPTGPWVEVPNTAITANTQKPVRRTFTVDVPAGEYVVRGRNQAAEIPTGQQGANSVTWDFAGGYIDGQILRSGISEIAMKIKAGPGLSITQFSQIEVLVQRKIPCWRGGTFVMQETRKSLDAFVDIAVDANYGAGMDPDFVDLSKVAAYLGSLTQFDTYDGQINGPISVWEAWATVLGPMRSEPVQRGNILSFQRDEAQTIRRHHFTRRQILSGSSGGEVNLNRGEGTASVKAEFFTGGDPRRRNEATARYGPEPLASTIMALEGVTDHEHATHLVRWTAAANFYRRETRRFRIELQHRSILPGDMIGLDTWFMSKGITLGLGALISGTRYAIEGDPVWPVTKPSPLYAYIIDRQGREFGPLGCTVDEAGRWVEFNSGDISAAQTAAGFTLAQAIQPDDGGLPTHLRIGTLTEITENWIVRAIRPNDQWTADIEVVNDAPEVWAAIGEGYTEPPEVFEVEDTDPPIPRVRWVQATVAQVQQGLVCRWSVSPTRGAVGYVVQVSRDDGATWGEISNGPSTTGEFAIEHIPAAVNKIRARGWGRFGVPGPWATADFSTVVVSITGEVAEEFTSLRADLQTIADRGEALIDQQIGRLQQDFARLAERVATHAGTTYDNIEYFKVASDQSFAAVEEEKRLRVEANEVEAEQRLLIAARLDDPTTGLEALGAVQVTHGVHLTNLDGITTAQASSITAIESAITDPSTGLSANAAAVNSLSTTVTLQGGSISAQATSITALQASVAGASTVSLTTLQEAFSTANGTASATWGVAFAVDGAAIGGFRMIGFKRPGTPGYVQFGIGGDLIVDGAITTRTIEFGAIKRGKVTIGEITSWLTFSRGGVFTLTTTPQQTISYTFSVQEDCDIDITYIAFVSAPGLGSVAVNAGLMLDGTLVNGWTTTADNPFWTFPVTRPVLQGAHTITAEWVASFAGPSVNYETITVRTSYR